MADRLYFAYGSNINLYQMDYRCPDATVVGPVALENYELLFRRGGFATIAPKEGGKVHGLLWSITPECERSLDMYEGYPRFYDKRTVTVRDGLGQELPVMAYIMDERFREPMLPMPETVRGGKRAAGTGCPQLRTFQDSLPPPPHFGAGGQSPSLPGDPRPAHRDPPHRQ